MTYTMATIQCDDCGHNGRVSQRRKTHTPGTKIKRMCWNCPERDDGGWAIAKPHTVIPKVEGKTYMMGTAACAECGHERRFRQSRACEPSTKLKLDCSNRNSDHRWHVKPHTVIARGAGAGHPNSDLVREWQAEAIQHRQGMFDAACNIENLVKGFISKMKDGAVKDPDDFGHLAESLENEAHEFNYNRGIWHTLNLACNANKDRVEEESAE